MRRGARQFGYATRLQPPISIGVREKKRRGRSEGRMIRVPINCGLSCRPSRTYISLVLYPQEPCRWLIKYGVGKDSERDVHILGFNMPQSWGLQGGWATINKSWQTWTESTSLDSVWRSLSIDRSCLQVWACTWTAQPAMIRRDRRCPPCRVSLTMITIVM